MKEIKLTKGFVALVDDEDYEYLNQFNWGISAYKYACRAAGKLRILMHREIMCAAQGQIVDHIDGNCLNNQKVNLRLCSHTQNIRNQKRRRDNSSGFKGVSWDKRLKKWGARIQVNGKPISLGYFSDKKRAAEEYNIAAIQHFGLFAKLNEVS